MLTNDDLTALDAAAAKATKGPWERYQWPDAHRITRSGDDETLCEVPTEYHSSEYEGHHNAAHIAAADPSAVRALVAEVRRGRELRELLVRSGGDCAALVWLHEQNTKEAPDADG